MESNPGRPPSSSQTRIPDQERLLTVNPRPWRNAISSLDFIGKAAPRGGIAAMIYSPANMVAAIGVLKTIGVTDGSPVTFLMAVWPGETAPAERHRADLLRRLAAQSRFQVRFDAGLGRAAEAHCRSQPQTAAATLRAAIGSLDLVLYPHDVTGYYHKLLRLAFPATPFMSFLDGVGEWNTRAGHVAEMASANDDTAVQLTALWTRREVPVGQGMGSIIGKPLKIEAANWVGPALADVAMAPTGVCGLVPFDPKGLSGVAGTAQRTCPESVREIYAGLAADLDLKSRAESVLGADPGRPTVLLLSKNYIEQSAMDRDDFTELVTSEIAACDPDARWVVKPHVGEKQGARDLFAEIGARTGKSLTFLADEIDMVPSEALIGAMNRSRLTIVSLSTAGLAPQFLFDDLAEIRFPGGEILKRAIGPQRQRLGTLVQAIDTLHRRLRNPSARGWMYKNMRRALALDHSLLTAAGNPTAADPEDRVWRTLIDDALAGRYLPPGLAMAPTVWHPMILVTAARVAADDGRMAEAEDSLTAAQGVADRIGLTGEKRDQWQSLRDSESARLN